MCTLIDCGGEEPVVSTETTSEVVVTENVDSTAVKPIDESVTEEPVVITLPKKVKEESVEIVVNPNDNEVDDPDPIAQDTTVATTKYTGKEELTNGTIDWEVYADKLYATKFKLTTKDSVVTNTTTITKRIIKSKLYAGGGVDMNWDNKRVEGYSVGLMYARKQNYAIAATINHDITGLLPPDKATTVGFRVWIGLGK